MGQTISRPSGSVISLSARLASGVTEYIGLGGALEESLILTTSSATAATFILEDSTGWLYQVDTGSYYPIATISYSTTT